MAFVGCVHDDHLAPVAAALAYLIRTQAAVFGKADAAQRSGAISTKGVGVEEYFRLAVALLAVEHALVLQAVVFVEIGPFAAGEGRRVALVVPQLLQAGLHGGFVRNGVEVSKSHFVLGFHPLGGFFATVVFEPAVGVGHAGAEVLVHHGAVHAGFGIGKLHFFAFVFTGGQDKQGTRRDDDRFFHDGDQCLWFFVRTAKVLITMGCALKD